MADNLAPPAANPADRRPHQPGRASGTGRWLVAASVPVEWLIDTGAQIACLTQATAGHFRLATVAGSASGTTGGGGILVKSGLTTEFEVIDRAGSPQTVRCTLDVGVKPNNAGSEILGVDQVENAGAVVEWDPAAGTGRLRL